MKILFVRVPDKPLTGRLSLESIIELRTLQLFHLIYLGSSAFYLLYLPFRTIWALLIFENGILTIVNYHEQIMSNRTSCKEPTTFNLNQALSSRQTVFDALDRFSLTCVLL